MNKSSSTVPSPLLSSWLLATLLLLLGFGLRLYDLTDHPIDFHPTRQLRGAIIARGIYYRELPVVEEATRQRAIDYGNSTGQYEPPILESLVARTYLLVGGEYLWISRIYTSLFWIVGGVALFDLARRVFGGKSFEADSSPRFGSSAGALLALGYYLVLPFAVQASRSFQPDPGMVMWIVLAIWALQRWSEKTSWGWAITAGLLGGMALLTKVVAAYIIGGAALAVVISTLGGRRFWRNAQVWVMLVLILAPAVLYYATRQGRASEYFESWTISLSHLLLEPSVYMRWFSLVQDILGLGAILLALVGVLIAPPRGRWLLAGLWGGYLVYGLFLPYQMYTHNYYHLQLVPIVALSLAGIGQMLYAQIAVQPPGWRALLVVVMVVGLVYPSWVSVAEFNSENHRNEPAYWQEIASYLPTDGKIIALTQDYGYRMMYYGWRKVTLWPNRGERTLASLRGSAKEFEEYFGKRTEGKDYFLITAFGQFNDQPDLKQMLADNYPVVAQGDGYLVYDLR